MSALDVQTRGLKTVGEIAATNTLTFRAKQNGLAIAEALLSAHVAGAPVVDANGAVHSFTTIADAAKRMEERCVLNLPVEKDGGVTYSVSRHDLLRAWIGERDDTNQTRVP